MIIMNHRCLVIIRKYEERPRKCRLAIGDEKRRLNA